MRRYYLMKSILYKTPICRLLAGLAIVFSVFLAGSLATAASMGESCVDCHDQAKMFSSTFHGRAWTGMNSGYTCQSCHGSVDMHVSDPTRENIISFMEGGGKTPEEMDHQCMSCHADTELLSHWEVSSHSRDDVPCVSCHTIHTSKTYVDELTLCFQCHREKRGQIYKRSHHPIKEGKVKCSDCHAVHGSTATHNMLRADNVNQLCYKCHPDKRGPYIYEHPPVMEDCSICHAPHGSRHAKLLHEKVPNLCQDCHDWSRHPGTPYDANTAFTGQSPSNRFFSRSCLNCHGAIHGSTSFENHLFTR